MTVFFGLRPYKTQKEDLMGVGYDIRLLFRACLVYRFQLTG